MRSHTYTHKYSYTCKNERTHKHMLANTHIRITQEHMHTLFIINKIINTHSHTLTHTHTRTHKYIGTYTNRHTFLQTHTHTRAHGHFPVDEISSLAHLQIQAMLNTCMHTSCAFTFIETHTHTQTHTYSYI